MLVAAVLDPGSGLVDVSGVGEVESVLGLSPESGRETLMSKYISPSRRISAWASS